MCAPAPRSPTDSEIYAFLAENGYDENIDANLARKIAADWLKWFPRSGAIREGIPQPLDTQGYRFKPGQKQDLADFIFPPPHDSS